MNDANHANGAPLDSGWKQLLNLGCKSQAQHDAADGREDRPNVIAWPWKSRLPSRTARTILRVRSGLRQSWARFSQPQAFRPAPPRFLRCALVLLLAIGGVGLSPAGDQVPAAISQDNLDASKLALQGYDPVAYQSEGRALKGSAAMETRHEGAIYRFASAANRDEFNKNPERYVPAYGGWCATAMVRGEKVEIDPKNFKVTGGRLFLFFKAFYADARKEWVKDEPTNIAKADAQWKKILARP